MIPGQPPPGEPSLLDYLKSRLRFWDKSRQVQLPQEAQVTAGPVVQPLAEAPVQAVAMERVPSRLPWRSLLALFFALLAQFSFEPSPARTSGKGLFLYAVSAAFLVWAFIVREWQLDSPQEAQPPQPGMRVRLMPLLLGIPLAVMAFILFGGNLFTLPNVLLWLLALGCFIWAFWSPAENGVSIWQRLASFLRRGSWQVRVTWGALLVVGLIIIVAFFRLHNIAGVPSEPFSDHAEKILDVYDVSRGQTHIFFPRNTGREAIQMYLTLLVSWVFGTGLSFLSLKIGTVIVGLLTLPYMYLLGRELGGKRVGLLAVFFTGIAYWANVISRVGLRFPLYPLFVAPTLYYLFRGFRRRSSNDFIIAGLFLGFGLHGYSPFRIVPLVVLAAFAVYLLHPQSRGARRQAVGWLAVTALVSFIVFLPLARYWLDNPGSFTFRAFSRLEPGASAQISLVKVFFSNLWNALKMFNWDDGQIWVNSIPFRPALDVVSGALFIIGIIFFLARYIRTRHWLYLFLLLSVPLLQLPSILSLAFPTENPALNRAGGALVPVFILVAVALDGLLRSIETRMSSRSAASALSWVVVIFLALTSSLQNYSLVFNKYSTEFSQGAWNSSEMGSVIKQFQETYGSSDNVWIVPYPYWVDTRLPGVWAGIPNRDFALWSQDLVSTLPVEGAKLIMLNTADTADVEALKKLYPRGTLSTFHSATHIQGKDFYIFFIPAEE